MMKIDRRECSNLCGQRFDRAWRPQVVSQQDRYEWSASGAHAAVERTREPTSLVENHAGARIFANPRRQQYSIGPTLDHHDEAPIRNALREYRSESLT